MFLNHSNDHTILEAMHPALEATVDFWLLPAGLVIFGVVELSEFACGKCLSAAVIATTTSC
jgi:hypothetical protein